jgi:glutaredoxin
MGLLQGIGGSIDFHSRCHFKKRAEVGDTRTSLAFSTSTKSEESHRTDRSASQMDKLQEQIQSPMVLYGLLGLLPSLGLLYFARWYARKNDPAVTVRFFYRVDMTYVKAGHRSRRARLPNQCLFWPLGWTRLDWFTRRSERRGSLKSKHQTMSTCRGVR